jgi:uncharacterized protein with PQ loop repeat
MFTNSIFDALNQTEHVNARSVLRSIKVVYFSLILGLLSFLVVTFLISQKLKFTFDKSDPIIFANLVLFFLSVPIGYMVSQAMWNKIEKNLPLKDKLLNYQKGFLIRIATCEGVGLFSLVGFLLSDNLIYLVLTATILFIIYNYFPSLEKLELQMDLNQTELEELKK